jgi:hypothetical protein
MKNLEKRFQKIKSGRIPFSPEAAKWIWRVQVYKSLLKFVRGGGAGEETMAISVGQLIELGLRTCLLSLKPTY